MCRKLITAFFILFIFACSEAPEWSQYHERSTYQKESDKLSLSPQELWSWELPNDWQQFEKDSLRLLSFHHINDPDLFDGSIVALSGSAGGIEPNIKRWLGQLGIDLSEGEFDKFLDQSQVIVTEDNTSTHIINFSLLLDDLSKQSMLAGIQSRQIETIFFKMTGSAEILKREEENFIQFIKTFHKR